MLQTNQFVCVFFEGVKKDMAQKGARYILDNFDVFFSFLVHGNKVDIPTAMRAFIRLEKGLTKIIKIQMFFSNLHSNSFRNKILIV